MKNIRIKKKPSLGGYGNNLGLLLSSISLGSIGQLLMKAGVNEVVIDNAKTMLLAILNPLVLLGLSAYVLSSLIWLVVLTRLPLSVAYPFGAISYALVVMASALAGEYIQPIRYAGVFLIVVGILIIGSTVKNRKQ